MEERHTHLVTQIELISCGGDHIAIARIEQPLHNGSADQTPMARHEDPSIEVHWLIDQPVNRHIVHRASVPTGRPQVGSTTRRPERRRPDRTRRCELGA